MASELDGYWESISKRSSQYKNQGTTSNLTNALGAQAGLSNTAGGGNQVINTSSKIDGQSQFSEQRSTNNIPDDPTAYISSNTSVVQTSLLGSGMTTGTVNVPAESHVGPANTTGAKAIALSNTSITSILSVFSGATTYPASGTAGVNASGAGWGLSGSSIVFYQGTYSTFVAPMASGWVPTTNNTFFVNYNYTSTTVPIVVTNPNIPSSTPIGKQQAILGSVGQYGLGSSFGGFDVTR